MQEFSIGQRWLSETEPELGLGIIQSLDYRLVTVYFPGSEDERTYAKDNAPLSRIEFTQGDTIELANGKQLSVLEVDETDGVKIYLASDNDGTTAPVPETQLAHHLQLSLASDRLFSKQLDKPKWFELRYAALSAQQRNQASYAKGLIGARIDLIPHQLYIAHEVGNRYAPRVLLADEVGLGKTIEAGLIIHQQLQTHRAERVLISVPEPLVHQWFVEMIRRFNLHFSIFDEERVNAIVEFSPEQNPFLTEQLILCSHRFLDECDFASLQQADWDLLVIDEAHHLGGDQTEGNSNSKDDEGYQRIKQLSTQCPGLLLLTATPEQLGVESHYARLHLLDPDRFHSLNAFVEEQENYEPIAKLVNKLLDSPGADSINDIEESVAQELNQYLDNDELTNSNRNAIIQQLVDRNGTSRVMFRNTRKNISGFPKRHLHAAPLPLPEAYQHNSSTVHDDLIYPERQYHDESWCSYDPRMTWLQNFLKQHRQEKVLVICSHKETAIDLQSYGNYKLGLSLAVFHEDMDIISRDRAAAYFADTDDGAQALICSEIGSEGRNFQFAQHLVLFDLPLNPDLLEQRIGRLDRIGQQDTIHIHVPYFENHPQEILFHWYHEGMNGFEATNAAGTAINAQTRDALYSALQSNQRCDELIEKTRSISQQIRQQLESGRDQLLEISSSDVEISQRLIEEIRRSDQINPSAFLERVFDCFGIDSEPHDAHSLVIKPGDHMVTSAFPHLSDEGQTITYDRAWALSRDDVQLASWEHPLVISAIDLITSQTRGKATVCTLKNKAIKPGTLLLEVLYTVCCPAPRRLQAHRFQPDTVIRFLVDINGNNMADKIAHNKLNAQCHTIEKHIGKKVIESQETLLKNLLAKTDQLASEQTQRIVANSLATMRQYQSEETNRLLALQKKNPNIRPEELDYLQQQTELLEQFIAQSPCQLDAIRVIVTS